MSKELVPTTYVPSGLVGATKADVLAELRRRQRAGEIHSAGGPESLQLITRGPHAGQYGIPVLLIHAPRVSPWPRRRRIVASVAATVGVLAGLGWWAASTLGAGPLVALLLAVLVLFGRRVYARHGRQEVTVTTTTTVSWR